MRATIVHFTLLFFLSTGVTASSGLMTCATAPQISHDPWLERLVNRIEEISLHSKVVSVRAQTAQKSFDKWIFKSASVQRWQQDFLYQSTVADLGVSGFYFEVTGPGLLELVEPDDEETARAILKDEHFLYETIIGPETRFRSVAFSTDIPRIEKGYRLGVTPPSRALLLWLSAIEREFEALKNAPEREPSIHFVLLLTYFANTYSRIPQNRDEIFKDSARSVPFLIDWVRINRSISPELRILFKALRTRSFSGADGLEYIDVYRVEELGRVLNLY